MTKSNNTQPTSKPRRVLPISRADFAVRAGVSKAAITQACKGCLKPAALADGNVDMGHPAAIAYVELHRTPAVTRGPIKPMTLAEFCERTGVSMDEVGALIAPTGKLSDAFMPKGSIMPLAEFASKFNIDPKVIQVHIGELKPALTTTGEIYVLHDCAVEFVNRVQQ